MDIFENVNFVSLALQGKDIYLLHYYKKLCALKMKLTLWQLILDNKIFAPFLHLNAFLDENELQINADVLEVIPLVESYQKTLKNSIPSFPAWRSAFSGG